MILQQSTVLVLGLQIFAKIWISHEMWRMWILFLISQCRCLTCSSPVSKITRQEELKQAPISPSPITLSLQIARIWCSSVVTLYSQASSAIQRQSGFWRRLTLSISMTSATGLSSSSTNRLTSLSSKMYSKHLKCPLCNSYILAWQSEGSCSNHGSVRLKELLSSVQHYFV